MLNYAPFALLRAPAQSLDIAYAMQPVENALLSEGIYLSSTDFWDELQKQNNADARRKDKLLLSLNKYRLRSCTRCTPYGTFAGICLVHFTDGQTSLTLRESKHHIKRVRVDTNYITEIIGKLAWLPHVRAQLKFYVNNSLYELPDGYRYVAYTMVNNIREYQLVSIGKEPYVRDVFDSAENGAGIHKLEAMLVRNMKVSKEEAIGFITEMQQAQLLIPELEPCVTGEDPLQRLIQQLENLEGVEELTTSLRHVQDLIDNIAPGVEHYKAIESALVNLAPGHGIPANTLQTDLFLSARQSEINEPLIAAIVEQAGELLRLSMEARNPDMDEFVRRFHQRYEDAEIPLSIALDADMGIGYASVRDEANGGSDLIDDIEVINGYNKRTIGSPAFFESFVASKYRDHLKHHEAGIVITEEELRGLDGEMPDRNFPSSMYLMGSLLKQDRALDRNQFLFDIAGFRGPSGGSLLGRFTHGDEQLCSLTKQILKLEEEGLPEAIFAEIVHLPQARTGNILLRPVLRNYEIPYIGMSGAPEDQQIPVQDIWVSIRNGQVYLRSKRNGRRIIPRLTTAHNFSHGNLPVYKFLCDLQFEDLAFPRLWDWGSLSSLKHLPRVTYKNLILQKAKWTIIEKDVSDRPADRAELGYYFQTFCARHSLPKRVLFVVADNELLIDFSEEQGQELFLHYLKRYKKIQLTEFLFTEENCVVRDAKGRPYTNELIIPLHNEQNKPADAKPATASCFPEVKRKFSPNSEWQYFKVYAGSKTAERILWETILPFVEKGMRERLFEHFFFIRYHDDFGHLRIRFFNSDVSMQPALQSEFMSLLSPLLEASVIDQISVDTYKREIERYGGNLIELVEMLFHNDSLAVLRFLFLLERVEEADRYRMLLALRGIDHLLNDFSFTLMAKHKLMKILMGSYFKEFGARPELLAQLNRKYRKHMRDIFSHMDPANDSDNGMEDAAAIFNTRTEMNKPIVTAIVLKLLDDQALQSEALLRSCIHMFMNRLFIAQQRKYELVAYHFLEKYYASEIAIERGKHVRQSLNEQLS